MVKRPIINTRDEPHAEPSKYRRFHVIVGDANMAELSTYLKIGATSIVLDLLEAGVEIPTVDLDDPVRTIKEVSRDLTVKKTLKLADGKVTTAIEIQRIYLKAALDFYACHELNQVTKDILVRWEEVLDKLEQDPMLLVRDLDWVAKRQMIYSYVERKGCDWNDPRVRLMDLQYHDVRPEKGLYYTLERSNLIERLLQDSEITKAEHHPPTGTRAYFRGHCLKKFGREIYAASWTSVLFDIGNTTIKKIPLMEPLRGTESLTRELLEGSDSAESLLAKLTA
jgi:proteasome accessory factor A